MSTFQLEQVENNTTMERMIQFIQDAIQFGLANGGSALLFNKRGSFIPKCRKGYDCELVDHYDDDYSTEWSNSRTAVDTKRICRFRHGYESHGEFYARTGLEDTRSLRPFRAYLHIASGATPTDAAPSSIKWRQVREWRDPLMGRNTRVKLGDLMGTPNTFESLAINGARQDLRVRTRYDHITDSLNYKLDLVGDESWFYFDASRAERERKQAEQAEHGGPSGANPPRRSVRSENSENSWLNRTNRGSRMPEKRSVSRDGERIQKPGGLSSGQARRPEVEDFPALPPVAPSPSGPPVPPSLSPSPSAPPAPPPSSPSSDSSSPSPERSSPSRSWAAIAGST